MVVPGAEFPGIPPKSKQSEAYSAGLLSAGPKTNPSSHPLRTRARAARRHDLPHRPAIRPSRVARSDRDARARASATTPARHAAPRARVTERQCDRATERPRHRDDTATTPPRKAETPRDRETEKPGDRETETETGGTSEREEAGGGRAAGLQKAAAVMARRARTRARRGRSCGCSCRTRSPPPGSAAAVVRNTSCLLTYLLSSARRPGRQPPVHCAFLNPAKTAARCTCTLRKQTFLNHRFLV